MPEQKDSGGSPQAIIPMYAFGDLTLDMALRELRSGGAVVDIQPKVFDLLVYLIARRDRVVGKDELQTALWPDVIVTEASLTRCVAKCRQALQDNAEKQAVIKTVHGRGYRFVAVLNKQEDHEQPVPARPSTSPDFVATEKPTIAVLPFSNASDSAEDDMFATGLTEDIIVDLSRNGWLYVISRNSSFSYKGQLVPSQTVAEELGVRYVVEGSVRKFGEQLRVVVELVDAVAGRQEWSQRYDRSITGIFELQDEICLGIVGALGSELRKAEGRRARQVDSSTLDAWGLVHRGMAVSWMSFNADSNYKAEQLYRRAVDIAPADPRAHAFLANSLAMRAINGWARTPGNFLQEAREHGQIASDSGSDDPIVLGQLAHMHTCFLEPDTAYRLFQRSIELDPNGIWSLGMRSLALVALGRAKEAIEYVNDAIRRSPRDPSLTFYLAILSWACMQMEDFAAGAEYARQATMQYNGWHATWVSLGICLGFQGDIEKAREAIDRGRELAAGITREGYEAYYHYMSKDDAQGNRIGKILKEIWV